MKVLKCSSAQVIKFLITILILTILIYPYRSYSDSLSEKIPKNFSLFSDREPKRIGDLVTILIMERSSARGAAETEAEKDIEYLGGPGIGLLEFFDNWAFSARGSSAATGSTARSSSLTAKITCRVIDVLPGGNLKIEGTQVLRINREKQIITITGIIREEDITALNTIYSYYVSDAQIKYDGKGPVSRKQREGILSRIFGWIF